MAPSRVAELHAIALTGEEARLKLPKTVRPRRPLTHRVGSNTRFAPSRGGFYVTPQSRVESADDRSQGSSFSNKCHSVPSCALCKPARRRRARPPRLRRPAGRRSLLSDKPLTRLCKAQTVSAAQG